MVKTLNYKHAIVGTYPIDSYVLVRNEGPSKSHRPYLGPYKITGHDEHGGHFLRTLGGGGAKALRDTYPTDKLKPTIDIEEFDTIESILDCRLDTASNNWSYQVKARNFNNVLEIVLNLFLTMLVVGIFVMLIF